MKLQPQLKQLLAEQLTCANITLKPDEISIRLIPVAAAGMIASVEIEIHAHSFPERIQKQDQICQNIRQFMVSKLPRIDDVRVWLALSELGHSW
jgi:hypothetical protein